MTPDLRDWPELSRLLDEALDLPDEAARERWLAALPQAQAALAPRLATLLAARGKALEPVLPERALRPGARVGPWTLQRELGRGGMAEVWLATREGRPTPVALKLPAVSLPGSSFLERFARERDFLLKLDHPHIAKLVEAGVDPSGQQYLALDYVDGEPIDVACDRRDLDLAARVALLRQVLDAVGHAHERGIAHRDLKPANILVTADGRAMVLDFGVAKLLVEGEAEETQLTKSAGRPLTLAYASPEQVAGETVTPATDVYSLGVLACELLAGARPYALQGDSRAALEKAILAAQPKAPSECIARESAIARRSGGDRRLARLLRPRFDPVVLKALRRAPAERYASARAFSEDLALALAGRPLVGAAVPPGERVAAFLKRHRAVLAVGVLLVLGLGNLQKAHRFAGDVQQWLARPLPAAGQVALVSIGPADYRALFDGRSPLDAPTLGKLVARILEGKPAAVAVDVDTSAPAFTSLAQAFDAKAPIVWALEARGSPGAPAATGGVLGGALPLPASAAAAVTLADQDDRVTRQYVRRIATDRGALPALPFAVVERSGLRPPAPAADDAPLTIRYTPSDRLDVPAAVVLAPGFDWKGRIEGRIVVLGGRYDRADVHETPVGALDGMDVVANAIESELAGGGLRRPPMWQVVLLGLAQMLAVMWLFDRVSHLVGVALAFGGAAVLATVLAATGLMPAWPYAFFTIVPIIANQIVIEHVRRERAVLNALYKRLKF